jgi:hypothetical protein
VAFAACWLVGQAALVLSGPERPDGAFAFRMFPEASTLEIHLERDVGGVDVPATEGEWAARDREGQLRHFSWRDRVRDPVLSAVDRPVFASYGADAQLQRLQRALDDVADHVPGDADTRRLRAVVLVRRNGHDAERLTLESHVRPEAAR